MSSIRDKEFRLSIRGKLILSLSLIGITLLVSSVISMMEYTRMSTYVSDLIAGNIRNINSAQKLSELSSTYNLDLLTVIGEDGQNVQVPTFDENEFLNRCDTLKASITNPTVIQMVDSVMYSFSAYMLTSYDLKNVLLDDFTDTRDWYFFTLQPKYKRLKTYLDSMTTATYDDLQKNSFTFQRGFYRSIVPGFVAVLVGLILILLLMFFIIAYYVNPLAKMLKHLQAYKDGTRKDYEYTFEGNDELSTLNNDIKEIVGENIQQKKRVSALRDALSQKSMM